MEPVNSFGQTQEIIRWKGHSTFGMNCLLLIINVFFLSFFFFLALNVLSSIKASL